MSDVSSKSKAKKRKVRERKNAGEKDDKGFTPPKPFADMAARPVAAPLPEIGKKRSRPHQDTSLSPGSSPKRLNLFDADRMKFL